MKVLQLQFISVNWQVENISVKMQFKDLKLISGFHLTIKDLELLKINTQSSVLYSDGTMMFNLLIIMKV